MSDTAQEEDFVLLSGGEGASEGQAAATPRRRWLPWRRRAPAPAPAAASSPAGPLSAIPILSLPRAPSSASTTPTTFTNPLAVAQPHGSPPSLEQQQPLQLFALPPQARTISPSTAEWLQRLPDPPLRPGSGQDDADSVISGISACTSSDGEEGLEGQRSAPPAASTTGAGSSFAQLHYPSLTALSLPTGGSSGSRSSTRASSSGASDLMNLLMQQGEPAVARSSAASLAPRAFEALPVPAPPLAPWLAPPVAAAPSMPAPASASTAAAGSTPNPLLQMEAPPGPALLSWRRHALAWQHPERREAELLRRLLSHNGLDEEEACGEGGAGPTSPPVGATAAGGASAGRGRASGKHLLVLTAVLAVMVLLLHALHTQALRQHQMAVGGALEQHHTAQMLQQAAGADAEVAALRAAATWGGGRPGGGFGDAKLQQPWYGRAGLPRPRHGHGQQQPASLHRLPCLHLRRLTLLLLTTHQPAEGAAGAAGGEEETAEGFVFEEWEVDGS